MSSGKTHDKAGFLTAALIGAYGIATGNLLISSAGVGCFIGTSHFSPDLDLSHSVCAKRWLFFNPLWSVYRRVVVRRHRSWLSHSPVISTGLRLVYFGCLLASGLALGYMLGVSPQGYPWILNAANNGMLLVRQNPQAIWGLLAGLELATDLHLILDFSYSATQKRKKRR